MHWREKHDLVKLIKDEVQKEVKKQLASKLDIPTDNPSENKDLPIAQSVNQVDSQA